MFVTDLDDTLYKERDFVLSGFNAIGEILGNAGIVSKTEVIEILEHATDMRCGFETLTHVIRDRKGVTMYDDKWMVDIYRNHIPTLKLEQEVTDLLEWLYENNHRIGIITDGRSRTQRAKIEALGLYKYVSEDNIIISSEVGGDKTTSIPFETLTSRNPTEKHFIYLGDNPAKDFIWPNLMGWKTIQLNDIFDINIHSQSIMVSSEYKAQYRIDRIEKVRMFL